MDNIELRMRLGLFPNCNPPITPARIKCRDCQGPGWGPMLTTEKWDAIKPAPRQFESKHDVFLCQPCMEVRLGRPLQKGDLRDCPMNYTHEHYVANNAH